MSWHAQAFRKLCPWNPFQLFLYVFTLDPHNYLLHISLSLSWIPPFYIVVKFNLLFCKHLLFEFFMLLVLCYHKLLLKFDSLYKPCPQKLGILMLQFRVLLRTSLRIMVPNIGSIIKIQMLYFLILVSKFMSLFQNVPIQGIHASIM